MQRALAGVVVRSLMTRYYMNLFSHLLSRSSGSQEHPGRRLAGFRRALQSYAGFGEQIMGGIGRFGEHGKNDVGCGRQTYMDCGEVKIRL